MRCVIIPQAIKNILAGTRQRADHADQGDFNLYGYRSDGFDQVRPIVQSRTYAPWVPYLSIALIYLVIVLILDQAARHF